MDTRKNWIATYYDKNNKVISSHKIENRTEHEASKEAEADMPKRTDDWSLVTEEFYQLERKTPMPLG